MPQVVNSPISSKSPFKFQCLNQPTVPFSYYVCLEFFLSFFPSHSILYLFSPFLRFKANRYCLNIIRYMAFHCSMTDISGGYTLRENSSFLSQQRSQKAAVSLTTGLSRPPSVCLRNSGVQEPMSAYLLMLRVTLMSASMGLCQGWDSLGPATHYGRSSFFLCLQGLPHSTWYVSWCGSLTYS